MTLSTNFGLVKIILKQPLMVTSFQNHTTLDRLQNGRQNRNISAFFGQVTNKLSNKIDIVFGLRHDNFDAREIFSPRIAFAFKRDENITYRFSYGHGFRTPSFSERLIDWENAQVGYTIKGNPSLKPEISKGLTQVRI